MLVRCDCHMMRAIARYCRKEAYLKADFRTNLGIMFGRDKRHFEGQGASGLSVRLILRRTMDGKPDKKSDGISDGRMDIAGIFPETSVDKCKDIRIFLSWPVGRVRAARKTGLRFVRVGLSAWPSRLAYPAWRSCRALLCVWLSSLFGLPVSLWNGRLNGCL